MKGTSGGKRRGKIFYERAAQIPSPVIVRISISMMMKDTRRGKVKTSLQLNTMKTSTINTCRFDHANSALSCPKQGQQGH